MKNPVMQRLPDTAFLKAASRYKATGKLAVTTNHLVYLDIDDAYVHQLYPLIASDEIIKPEYFKPDAAGAHISVVYPEEKIALNNIELGQEHRFTLRNLVAAEIGAKTYYALMVESASLLSLRRKLQLPDLLCFKGYAIGFHITIGVTKRIP